MKLTTVAELVVLTCTTEQIAGIIQSLLSCEDIENITDEQADAGTALFHELCRLAPDVCRLPLSFFSGANNETRSAYRYDVRAFGRREILRQNNYVEKARLRV